MTTKGEVVGYHAFNYSTAARDYVARWKADRTVSIRVHKRTVRAERLVWQIYFVVVRKKKKV
jgi:hypothetical protein